MSQLHFSFVLVFISNHFQACEAVASELEIYQAIFKGYDKNIRPAKDAYTTTIIDIIPQWLTVLGIDATREEVQFVFDYKQVWKDEYLKWNRSDYGGIDYISVPEELIWVPDVCMVFSYETTPLIALERRKVRIKFDGSVTMWNPQIVSHACKMTIDSFPFDSQTCSITLSPWSLRINDVVAKTVPLDQLSISQKDSSEWRIIYLNTSNGNVTLSSEDTYSLAQMTFTIKRNPVYYICVFIIPTFVMTTLCTLGIFAPFSSTGDREEKVSLGLTTLLTIAVILSAVAGEMPKTTKLPLIGWFVLDELAICTLAIIISVLIMFLHQRVYLHDYSPPGWLSTILMCKINTKTMEKSNQNSFRNRGRLDGGIPKEMDEAMNDLRNTLEMVRNCIEEQKDEELLHYQWSIIINRIDLIFLITFQVVNILLSVAVFREHF